MQKKKIEEQTVTKSMECSRFCGIVRNQPQSYQELTAELPGTDRGIARSRSKSCKEQTAVLPVREWNQDEIRKDALQL